MTEDLLLKHGFVKMGKEDGYEFLIHQYDGYSDFVFYNVRDNRFCAQYKLSHIELQNCNLRKANIALHLMGLPDIDKLKKE